MGDVALPREVLPVVSDGACPVTTDLILRVDARTTTTTTTTTTKLLLFKLGI